MKPGDRVKIYFDPLTERDYEGTARLVEQLPNDTDVEGLELWKVKFPDNGEGIRWIKKKE